MKVGGYMDNLDNNKTEDSLIGKYVTYQMLRERSIAIKIIDLLTEENVTYGEWANIYHYVNVI